jgi:hypothetical protein
MTTQSSSFNTYERIEQAKMPSTRALFAYWQAKLRDNLPPRRTDIDPAAIKSILPFILLGDIEPDPFRVRFRLVGTAVVDFSRHDFSGRYLDELAYKNRDSVEWSDCYRYIHTHHVSVIGINELRFLDGHHASYEFAIMPLLRDDDPAGSFIAIEAYDQFDHLHIPDLNPVTRLP